MRAVGYDSVAAAGTATENQASGDIVPVENAAPVVAVPVTDPAAVAVVVAFEGTSAAGVVGHLRRASIVLGLENVPENQPPFEQKSLRGIHRH